MSSTTDFSAMVVDGLGYEVILAVVVFVGIFALLLSIVIYSPAGNNENGNFGERFQLQPRPASVQLEACPICLEDSPQLAVQTSCGHHFCGPCFLRLWNDRLLNSVACPLCRQAVTILFPVFTAEELSAANRNNADGGQVDERVGQVLERVNRFNRYNSGRGVPLTDLLRDFPTLVRHFVSDLFSPNGFSFIYLARLSIIMVMCLAYLLSPLDILPEAVFGLLGVLDDIVVLLLSLIFIVFMYRNVVAQRQFHA